MQSTLCFKVRWNEPQICFISLPYSHFALRLFINHYHSVTLFRSSSFLNIKISWFRSVENQKEVKVKGTGFWPTRCNLHFASRQDGKNRKIVLFPSLRSPALFINHYHSVTLSRRRKCHHFKCRDLLSAVNLELAHTRNKEGRRENYAEILALQDLFSR